MEDELREDFLHPRPLALEYIIVGKCLNILNFAPEWFWEKHVTEKKLERLGKDEYEKGHIIIDTFRKLAERKMNVALAKKVLSLFSPETHFSIENTNESHIVEINCCSCSECDSGEHEGLYTNCYNVTKVQKYFKLCGYYFDGKYYRKSEKVDD